MNTPIDSPAPAERFRWPVRVYYEDTDAGGVVYHAGYLCFMERARTERMRTFGFQLDELREQSGLLFVVRSMQIDFRKPARFNDELWVTADIGELRSASLTFHQAVMRGEEILCQAAVRVVCLAAEAFGPAAIPDFLLRHLREAVVPGL